MSKHDRKIEQLNNEISASKLETPHKTYASDVLGEVAACANGHPDKAEAMTDAILANTSYMIRRDIYLQETHDRMEEQNIKRFDALANRVIEIVKTHADTCPLEKRILDALQARAVSEMEAENGGMPTVTVKGHGNTVRARGDAWTMRIVAAAILMVAVVVLVTKITGG